MKQSVMLVALIAATLVSCSPQVQRPTTPAELCASTELQIHFPGPCKQNK